MPVVTTAENSLTPRGIAPGGAHDRPDSDMPSAVRSDRHDARRLREDAPVSPTTLQLTLVRNATLLLELEGRRILVDPMLDDAGARPPVDNTPNARRDRTSVVQGTTSDQGRLRGSKRTIHR